jgi:hypothetical protein
MLLIFFEALFAQFASGTLNSSGINYERSNFNTNLSAVLHSFIQRRASWGWSQRPYKYKTLPGFTEQNDWMTQSYAATAETGTDGASWHLVPRKGDDSAKGRGEIGHPLLLENILVQTRQPDTLLLCDFTNKINSPVSLRVSTKVIRDLFTSTASNTARSSCQARCANTAVNIFVFSPGYTIPLHNPV